jgi:hypothetical protein
MNPERLVVGEVIKNRYPLYVPMYQRGYAWENAEIDDFTDDCLNLFKRLTAGKNVGHFFGGIVTIQLMVMGRSQGSKLEIVDGQQRLATFTLVMSMIVQKLIEVQALAKKQGDSRTGALAEIEAKDIQDSYIYYYETDYLSASRKQHHRLTLSDPDNTYFESLVRGEVIRPSRTAPASHKRLYKAAKSIKDNLVKRVVESSTLASEQREQLELLRRALTESCYCILIRSTESHEAYQLFSILNDRGKSLTAGDLLRSYTLELLEGYNSQQEEAKDMWDDILSYNTRLIDGFLGTYYASTMGERSPKGELFRDTKDTFFESIKPLGTSEATAIRSKIATLRDEQLIYNEIVDSKWSFNEGSTANAWEKARLQRLIGVLKHDLCVPLLLSLCIHSNERTLVTVLQLLERFVFRYIHVTGGDANPLREIYYHHSKKIREGEVFNFARFERELCELSNKSASDDVFKAQLMDGSLDYNDRSTQQKSYIKHFLLTLDDHSEWYDRNKLQPRLGKPQPSMVEVVDIVTATIDHIYPQQTPEDQKVPSLEELIHDIGNLTLLSGENNSRSGNRSFAEKKPMYAQSRLSLTRNLSVLSIWDEQTLKERRDLMIDMALKIFKIGNC